MSETRAWTAGTALVLVLLLVASWFLLISPKRSQAAEVRASTVAQESANQSLRSRIEELKVQAEGLPTQEARLAEMATQIPEDAELPTLIRDLTAAADASGAALVSLNPATPLPLPASVPVAPVLPAPTEAETGEAAPAAAPVIAAAPAAPVYMVPVSMQVAGSYVELAQFINMVEDIKRSFLVTGFTVSENTLTTGPAAGKALSVQLTGRVFIAPASDLAAAPVGVGTVDGTVPVVPAGPATAPSTPPAT